jgi:hypothetical protein
MGYKNVKICMAGVFRCSKLKGMGKECGRKEEEDKGMKVIRYKSNHSLLNLNRPFLLICMCVCVCV